MKLNICAALSVASLFALAEARPRYIAIPLEDLERSGFLAEPILSEIADNQRLLTYDPQGAASFNNERVLRYEDDGPEIYNIEDLEESSSDDVVIVEPRNERQKRQPGHGHDHVDYGAYTGAHGAFGWYTDHPVGKHHY